MNKLSFKEYYESKLELKQQNESTVIFKTTHDIGKYCKVPFMISESKVYVSLKPRDSMVVEWKRTSNDIVPLSFNINGVEYLPSWNSSKMKTWVQQTATQIFEAV